MRNALRFTWIFAFVLCFFASGTALAGKKTTFDPTKHGFAFANTFNNDFVKDLDIRTGGLCGGMVYTVLDHYLSGKAIPRQPYRPANGTPLQSFIYNRQVDSIVPNATKWGELGINPGGARNAEFFSWGMTSEFTNLKTKIDAGSPAPIGLFGVEQDKTHQVLAIGYETDANDGLRAILLYDPNLPDQIVRMIPNAKRNWFQYTHDKSIRWRTYFVDKSHSAKTPPSFPNPNYPNDGLVRELLLTFETGDDDLRGGNDNVDLVIRLTNGKTIVKKQINLGARWLRNYGETASVRIPATPLADIAAFSVSTTFAGGAFGDNWDTKKIVVDYYLHSNVVAHLVTHGQFKRFTGEDKTLKFQVPKPDDADPNFVRKLELTIKTGNDDLRGNEDNVDATILYADGKTQTIKDLNNRQRWEDGSEHTVTLKLDKPRPRNQVVGLKLTTTFKGGVDGDNWNMDKLVVVPITTVVTTAYATKSGVPLKRFTGDSKTYKLEW
jgi:hypothetical protein